MRLSCAENSHVLDGSMVEILDVSQDLYFWCFKSRGTEALGPLVLDVRGYQRM